MKRFLSLICALACLAVLCLSTFTLTALAAPNSMAIVGASIPGVADWDPADPAGDMDEVETGIYVKILEVAEPVTMTIKFAGNDGWDDSCNYGSGTLVIDGEATELVNGGDSQNMSLEVTEPCILVFTLDLNSDVATVMVESAELGSIDVPGTPDAPETPETPETPDAEEMVTVHAKVPASWTAPCFWAWEAATNTNAFAGWPGEAMTQDGEWFTIEIPVWVDCIIVNCNGAQTADTSVEAGKELWVVVADDLTATVTYEEPTLAPVEPPVEETEPAAPETEETEPSVKPTESQKSAEELEAERAAKRAQAIWVIVAVVAVIIVLAVVLSIVPGKFR